MEIGLQKKIESIVSIRLWKFDGLPDDVILKLDELLVNYESDEIIEEMNTLILKFRAKEKRCKADRGNSGIAGEMYMEIGMKLKYLDEGIDYLRSMNCKNI